MTLEDKISWIQGALFDQFGARSKTNPVVIMNRNLLGELRFNSPRIIVEQEDDRLYWIFHTMKVRIIDSDHIAYTDVLFFDMDKNGVIQFSLK